MYRSKHILLAGLVLTAGCSPAGGEYDYQIEGFENGAVGTPRTELSGDLAGASALSVQLATATRPELIEDDLTDRILPAEEFLGDTQDLQTTQSYLVTGPIGPIVAPEIWSNEGEVAFNNNLGFTGVGTKSPDAWLHVQGRVDDGDLAISSVAFQQNSALTLAEGKDLRYGMKWVYDGTANRLNLYGVKNRSLVGPHMSVERDSGWVSNLKLGNFDTGDGATNFGLQAQDRNHWVWSPYDGWGVFWATLEGAKYQTGKDPSNPNELVFVGGGKTRAAIDLDSGDAYFNKVVAKELTLSPSWADFVFEPQYPLMDLDRLERYIASNKHLPGIPSAEVVENEGVGIGESQARLLQKIEELTLYVIDLNKANRKQTARISSLEKRLAQGSRR